MKIFIYPHTTNNFQIKWSCPRTELIINEGFSKLPQVELVDSEINADYIIFHHLPQNNGEKSFELINKIDPKKLIVIDSIDENDQWFLPELNPDRYFLYFKRSLIKNGLQGRLRIPTVERQYAWDYAILDGFIQPEVKKTIDVGCYLRPSCYFRCLVLQQMQDWFNQNQDKHNIYIGEVSGGSRSKDNGEVYFDLTYFDFVAKTRVIVSSGPYGWIGDSRGAEAVANKCLYISNEFYSLMPNPPMPGVHYANFNPLVSRTLTDELDYLLSKLDYIPFLANEGYDYCMKYHTSKARCEYILQKIEENH